MNRTIVWTLALLAGLTLAARAEGDKGAEKGKGGGPGQHAERFAKADTNADGKLSLDEFKSFAKGPNADQKFATADADKDGFCTKQELKAAHGQRPDKGGPGPGDGKGECKKDGKKDV